MHFAKDTARACGELCNILIIPHMLEELNVLTEEIVGCVQEGETE